VSKPGNGNGGRTLSRDFKHVKRHATSRGGEAFNGWMGLGVGLAVGLSVALAVFLHYRGQPPGEPQAKPEATPQSDAASDETTVVGPASDDLTFYDLLKKQGVEVPPDTKGKPGAAPRSGGAPGGEATLQAGAFKQQAEAEKQIARLVALGINARIIRVPMDDETWYRVQIGPIQTVQELESIRRKLDDAEIEATAVAPAAKQPSP
jgi:cell division protein FtsN